MLKPVSYSYRLGKEIVERLEPEGSDVSGLIKGIEVIPGKLTRDALTKLFETRMIEAGWEPQDFTVMGFGDIGHRRKFYRGRVCTLAEFACASYMGIDLLKFQSASYAARDRIDAGVYVVPTRRFRDRMTNDYGLDWDGTLTFEKVREYLPYFREAVQVPVHVVGINI